jgi:predicted MFS family arabinose efflux permease
MLKIDQPADAYIADRVPPVAYVLTACIGVIGCNSLGLGPIAPAVAASLGTGVPTVMMAASAFGLGTAASALFLARHIDRVGQWRMLRLAIAAFAGALALSAIAPDVRLLIAAQLVAGIASGIALPAIYGGAAAVAPHGRESRTIGIVLTGWTLSMVAGVSLSALIADLVHWRAVYVIVAGLALAALAALSLAGRDRRLAGSSPLPLTALRTPGVKRLLVACGAFMAAFYGVYGYLGDHLHEGLGQSVSVNGLAALVYGFGFGGAALLDGIVDRLGAKRLMPFAFLAVAFVYGLLALGAGSATALIALAFIWGLANHFGLNILIMRLTALDPAQRGTIMGLNSAVTYLAVFAGTSGFAPIYQSYGFAACAALAAVLTLVSVVSALR